MASAESALLSDLSTNGWCLAPSGSSPDPTQVLKTLGPLFFLNPTGAAHHDLRPYNKASARPGSMSATIGTDAQPMHTDGAHSHLTPHYLALYCLDAGEASCPTKTWSLDLGRLQREASGLLAKTQWISCDGRSEPFYCPILDVYLGSARIRFDPFCMRPLSKTNITMDEVRALLESCSRKTEHEWKTGDLLIIDNWRCLHARGFGAAWSPSRRLRRWIIGGNCGLVL